MIEFIELPNAVSAVASDVVFVDSVSRVLRCEDSEESAAFVVSLVQSEATWLWAEEMSSPAVLTVVEIASGSAPRSRRPTAR